MTPESVMDLARNALYLTVMISAPLLLSALGIGLLIGILQAATQIQEMTLSFIPKLIALAVALAVAGPWMLEVWVSFTENLFMDIPGLIG
ncbi:flagellar biosynthesis protein FliQ [Porticoccus sp. W117]|uniref:flagellar biosynthesis protein FliQ n=1 Tax=Porticoccus sp. W117 TaxID=3054777 RepID=UPI0025962644|nr:flagellar biosynthesis protein FliQ [Porticoccus sp. W117]MDM3870980.1 flagellar biosynthesis protein FliQ [Porticoccus sp. W117]